MSDMYTALELAVVEMLKTLPELAGIKGWQTGVADSLVTVDAIVKGLRADQLPGVCVMAALEPVDSEPMSASQIKHMIPVSLWIVGRTEKPASIRAELFPYLKATTRAFDEARRSVNPLGSGALVMGPMSSSLLVVRGNPHSYGVVEVNVKVMKVEQL